METLYDPKNIAKFCSYISHCITSEDEDNLNSLLSVFQVLVCGPPGERCESFYRQRLSADRCVAAVLRGKAAQKELRSDGDKCEKLVRLFLRLPYLTSHLCRALSTVVTCLEHQPQHELKKEVASSILKHEDLHKFSLRTVNFCLRVDTTELELFLIRLCTQELDIDRVKFDLSHWIRWSSQSPEVFSTISGILNELIKLLKNKLKVLDIVNIFVSELSSACDKNDIDMTTLYPRPVQTLIELLRTDPNSFDEDVAGLLVDEIRDWCSYTPSKNATEIRINESIHPNISHLTRTDIRSTFSPSPNQNEAEASNISPENVYSYSTKPGSQQTAVHFFRNWASYLT